ncbi:MAG: NifU family protein [Alphaproteobacteria bacterium]
MSITTQPTPNPATLKFLLDDDILAAGTADFPDAATASEGSPLAARLFAVDGVDGVFLGRDFVTVTAKVDWTGALETQVAAAIEAHMATGEAIVTAPPTVPEVPISAADRPVVDRIEELLESHIRPGVALDGGNIAFRHYAQGIVYLELQGACAGCPSSTMTLRYSVENLLRHYVPEVREVRAIDAAN